MEFSLADGLLLLGMPIAAAIVVALIFVLIARTRVDSYLSPSARLRHISHNGATSP